MKISCFSAYFARGRPQEGLIKHTCLCLKRNKNGRFLLIFLALVAQTYGIYGDGVQAKILRSLILGSAISSRQKTEVQTEQMK